MKRATQCVATYMVCQLVYPTKVDLFFVLFNPFCNLCAYVHNDYICEEGSSTFLCVSTYSLSVLSEVVIRASPSSYAGLPARKLTVR